jgi:serine/threonine protein kinase
MLCPQNPNYPRRRNLTPNRAPHGRRRRAISDSTSPAPSAPARTRSPSPTEGYPIPAEYQCPITHVLFTDPVVASDGHTYERSAIVRWLKTQKVSPVTRGAISIDTLNPNRIVKKMVDDFRAECKRKRALYKYRLDIDVKKSEEVPYIKINTKSIYRAEWINKNSSSADSNIILIHLTGDNAEKIAETYCRLGPHPNIVRVFGRVEHSDNGILLLKECPPAKTLAQFSEQKLSITILDHIFYQIASALEHLNNAEIVHGNVTDENIFIYHLDAIPEDTLIKLTDIDDTEKSTDDKITPEILSANLESEESDVYAFGVLAKEMYLLELETSTEQQALFERCLSIDPNERPTFNELTKTLNDFIIKSKCI